MPDLRRTQNLGEDSGTMLCPDGHRCENFAICAENVADEGNYYCDCDASPISLSSKYAGLYCEHEATTYCTPDDVKTFHSFCTNGGKCKQSVNDFEEHRGCHCSAGYVGDHCQFIEGSMVPNWKGNPSQGRTAPDSNDGLSVGGIVGLVILALVVVVAAGLVASKKVSFVIGGRRDEREDVGVASGDNANGEIGGGPPVEAVGSESPVASPKGYGMSADLHTITLDADGGVLQEAMEEKKASENGGMDNEEDEDDGVKDVEII